MNGTSMQWNNTWPGSNKGGREKQGEFSELLTTLLVWVPGLSSGLHGASAAVAASLLGSPQINITNCHSSPSFAPSESESHSSICRDLWPFKAMQNLDHLPVAPSSFLLPVSAVSISATLHAASLFHVCVGLGWDTGQRKRRTWMNI